MRNKIVLSFGFLKKSVEITADPEVESFLLSYFAPYFEQKEFENRDSFAFHRKGEKMEVYSTFFSENPHMFNWDNCKVECLNILEDYLEISACSDNSGYSYLHGTAVNYNSQPIILLGKSHSGKSTAALKLLHMLHRASLISDDFLCISNNKDGFLLTDYMMPLHVRKNSLVYNTDYPVERISDNLFYLEQHKKVNFETFPISALFEITFGPANIAEQLHGIEKVSAILDNVKYYRRGVEKDAIELAKKTQIYRISYKDDAFLAEYICGTQHYPLVYKGKLADSQKKYYMKRNQFCITVQGDSMSPVINHNQKILINRNRDNLSVGDIILYENRGHLTLHRIIEKRMTPEGVFFRTKGDHNTDPDNYEVHYRHVIGKYNRNL